MIFVPPNRTMFCLAEQEAIIVDRVRKHRVAQALSAVRALMAIRGVRGIVLTTPGAVAWATGSMNPPVDRTAATDVVWLCVGPDRAVIVTTEVEAPRILAEFEPRSYGIEVVAVAWWDAAAVVSASERALDTGNNAPLGSDGHPAFSIDVTDDLTAARMPLGTEEQELLRSLGADATWAVQQALRAWTPGETDFDIQGRISGLVESRGADCPVLLVGADDRIGKFRHPIAMGVPASRLVMAVLVARRAGLHVALTRYVSVGAIDQRLADGLSASRRIHRKMLAATVPGATYGSVLEVLEGAYRDEGHPDAWRQHYQGGPIGYAQREFEISPAQRDSRWWQQLVSLGGAVAWNPSLPGGSKDEDTYLVGPEGAAERVTVAPEWPDSDDGTARPGVLMLDG